MKYFITVLLFFVAYRFHKWYGYERGKADPRFWRPIHSKEIVNLLVNLITIGIYVSAIFILINW